jgi:ABC-type antimicrobial peptide transport system permease subunit
MAIGAQRRDVIALVIRQGAALSGVGLAGGLLAVLIVSKWLLSLLYGVQPRDPGTLAGVSLLIAVVTLLGSYIPARRASRVDPMVALRYE